MKRFFYHTHKFYRMFHTSNRLRFAQETNVENIQQVKLNFSSPIGSVYENSFVDMVNVPGMTGVYAIGPSMPPTISELRPGIVDVFEKNEKKSYFIPAGYAITHKDSSTEIAAADIATLDDIDLSAAQKALAEAKSTLQTLTVGSQERAITQIEVDVYDAICKAANLST